DWHKPRIDLSVITNTRPRSLSRLLGSLTAARYFGDAVQVNINLEQTSDSETRRVASHFSWVFGVVHVRHRVIAAGLLPAVVEAWYPHNNNSYGVLLEDDVEVSPMLLFAEQDLLDSRTPYLSQVPCSWGAVYFPEHFREFHDYLALRLSESTHNISAIIVPDIRSNKWTRSWKKYFNELVYLRGYVMLYPNYDLSLATNHVEVGAHVKTDPADIPESVRKQYEVPLMPLPSVFSDRSASLLELPHGVLPEWDDIPVLDFWGVITSHQELVRR
ncbi:hypothetical protein K439DRAFT_1319759, partial [Ramaria rubella]